jgi:hypothetical protein
MVQRRVKRSESHSQPQRRRNAATGFAGAQPIQPDALRLPGVWEDQPAAGASFFAICRLSSSARRESSVSRALARYASSPPR